MSGFNWDLWVAFGLAGQLLFGSRFIVQWIASERKKVSYIPILFWYLSLCGGVITLIYAIHIRDTVFTIAQGGGLIVYLRNLMLIYRRRSHAQPGTAQPAPPDRP
ncbi:MAG TPA: lipid-A-disaccharide synthase N-terminal domain-containing protein [Thermoanaerobaculia bacterium]|nr:lipid-A-disaccharide synthase N-terminal domain-containing protein [Thermoanaerobaculia bacterium]